jgi:hypothetical protein
LGIDRLAWPIIAVLIEDGEMRALVGKWTRLIFPSRTVADIRHIVVL